MFIENVEFGRKLKSVNLNDTEEGCPNICGVIHNYPFRRPMQLKKRHYISQESFIFIYLVV
jgi:hypothetical protein